MHRIIYIDSVFFNNLVMDLFLLLLTAGTLKKTTTFVKKLAGSLIGAAGYCLVLCLPGDDYLKALCGMVPAAALMVKTGCSTKGLKELLYGMGYLFTYSFLMGGFILFMTGRVPFFKGKRDSLTAILLAGYLGFWLCRLYMEKYRKEKKNHFCKVHLSGDTGEIEVYGLIDTGNGLREPVSGKEVAILEEKVWQNMLKCKRAEKFKLIPFHSIGKENGILEGYEVEKIQIEEKTGSRDLVNVIIAVFKGNISAKGDYQMILPPQWF